jgi:uncharacterized protein DUF6941
MPDPYCLAMVLCDNVHRDPATGKHTILGTFSTVAAHEWPANVHLCVYYAITDSLGTTKPHLRLVDARSIAEDDDQVVFEIETGEYTLEDPLAVLEGVAMIQTQIPSPGVYHCELLVGDELLMSRRLLALAPPNKEGERDEQHD